MITVANTPLDVSLFLREYRPNSVEYELITTMANSSHNYSYDNIEQLRFELAMRNEIVNAARALNRSRFSFAVFNKAKSNPRYWEMTPNGGYLLKKGVKPSDAILDIFKNGSLYATECATAMMIVYYKALLDIYGADTFNKLFPSIYLMNWLSLDPLLADVGIPRNVAEILIGDRAYFKNPDVDPKNPEWQGENVIVLPNDLFYGHGMGIVTAKKIIQTLNSKRKRNATRSAYYLDTASRPNFKNLARFMPR